MLVDSVFLSKSLHFSSPEKVVLYYIITQIDINVAPVIQNDLLGENFFVP